MEMKDLPDLLTGPCVSCGPHGCVELISVEATSERGQMFLSAYYDAIDQQAGGSLCDDEIEFLTLLPKEFARLKRQASLVPVSVGELKDYPRL